MKEITCKKLQAIGAFALAGGCTKKRMREVLEMIRAARDYRWVGVYKIVNKDFVILAGSGAEPPAYPRFPITQGVCGAVLESGVVRLIGTGSALLEDPEVARLYLGKPGAHHHPRPVISDTATPADAC